MASTWADGVKADDYVSIGDVGEGIVTSTVVAPRPPPPGTWLLVVSVNVGDDGYTDLHTMDESGTLYDVEIPSAERVTVRRD